MIITCPSCTTNYDIDPSGVGAQGRQVKCASCATLWHVMPEQAVVEESAQAVAAVAGGSPVVAAEPLASEPDASASTPVSPDQETALDAEFGTQEPEAVTAVEASSDDITSGDTDSGAADVEEMERLAQAAEKELEKVVALSHAELANQLSSMPVAKTLKEEMANQKALEDKLAGIEPEEEEEFEEDIIDLEDEELAEEDDAAPGFKRPSLTKRDGPGQRDARMRRIAKRNRALANTTPAARIRRMWTMASVGGLVTMLLLIVVCQKPIVRILPDLAGLYKMVGINVNVLGLEFGQIKIERRHDNGSVSLVVTGTVSNVTRKPIELPKVLVSLQTSGGEEVYAWSIDPSVPYLDVGEFIEFKTNLSAPPAIADNVKLSFLTQGQ